MNRNSPWEPLKPVFYFIALLWAVHLVALLIPLQQFGIVPRTATGLIGIVSAPFLHGNLNHLIANSLGLLVFGVIFSILEGQKAFILVCKITLVAGVLTWLMARSSNHIGASGLIFGLYGYLLLKGLFDRSMKYIVVSIFVLVFYGSMIFGVLPSQPCISWEGHLFGFISGGLFAKNG